MKYISVCSGIEAATVAWHELGWQPAWFSEVDKFPSAVLQHHYPDVPNLGDMTKFMEWPDESIDLLVGGTPCQSFSVAGLRKGLDDPRGNLMLTYLAIAAKYRPKWLVWENVTGALSAVSHGAPDPCPPPPPLDLELDGQELETGDEYDAEELHALQCLLAGLSEIGYGVAYRVFDAQYSGVPQRRRRVFVVGCLGDWRGAAAVLFERHSLQGHSAPRREKKQTAPTLPSRGSAGGGLGTDFDCDGGLIAGTLTAGMGRRRGCGVEPGLLVLQPFETANCLTSRMAKGMNSTVDEGQTPIVAFNAKGDGGGTSSEVSPTLRAGGCHHSHANSGSWVGVSQEDIGVRRLLPIECERLQAFPDNYTQIPWAGKPVEDCPDGHRYKALGNSMCVNEMRWIGERIQAVSAITSPTKEATL